MSNKNESATVAKKTKFLPTKQGLKIERHNGALPSDLRPLPKARKQGRFQKASERASSSRDEQEPGWTCVATHSTTRSTHRPGSRQRESIAGWSGRGGPEEKKKNDENLPPVNKLGRRTALRFRRNSNSACRCRQVKSVVLDLNQEQL